MARTVKTVGGGAGRRRAVKVRRLFGGLAAGRTFSGDFGRFVTGELPKCANAGSDWQLAGRPPHRCLLDLIAVAHLNARRLNLQPLPTRDSEAPFSRSRPTGSERGGN
jgi:hypothetical protein